MLKERDAFRDDVNELKNVKGRLETTHSNYVAQSKSTINKLNNEIT